MDLEKSLDSFVSPNGLIIKATAPIVDFNTFETLGAVIVSFPFNLQMAQALKERTQTEITFILNDGKNVVSTLHYQEGKYIDKAWETVISDIELLQDSSHQKTEKIGNFLYLTTYTTIKNREDSVLGILATGVNISIIQYNKQDFIRILTISSGIVFFLAILVGIFTARSFTNPIFKLLQTIRLMSTGKLDERVNIKQNDEIGELAYAFNDMGEKIQNLTGTFQKFVPKQFLDRVAKEGIASIKLGNVESGYVTILFSDIRSFTTISESMTPEEIFRLLNFYMLKMEPPIQKYGGFVDKFIGDAIMALFDLETDQKGAHSAIDAAIGMQKALKIFNQEHSNTHYPAIVTGIGIHSGNVMIGTIGSSERMDSTAIGDAVNVASRIESMTKMYGSSILISDATYDKLTNPSQYSIRLIDHVTVIGKTKPVTVFEVFDEDRQEIKEKKLKTCKHFEEAISLYKLMKFQDVIEILEEHIKLFPEDKVAKIYIERCQKNMIEVSHKNWTGITHLNTK